MTIEAGQGLDNVMWIKGGTWIVYRFTGAIKDIFESLQGVFTIWLPKSGFHIRHRYCLNIYHQIDREKQHVIMDLCIPIA